MAHAVFHICSIYKEGVLVRTTNKRWDPRLNCWILDDNKTVMQKLLEEQRKEKEDVRRGNRYYDSRQNRWIDLDTGQPEKHVLSTESDPGDEQARAEENVEDGEGYMTCEIPKKDAATHPTLCVCIDCKPFHLRSHSENCSCWNCWSWKKAKGVTTESWASYGNPNYGQMYVEVKPWDGVDRAKWPNTFMYLMGQYYIHGRWSEGLTITNKEYQDRVLRGKYAPEPKPYYKKKYDEDATTEFWRYWGEYDHS